MKPVAVLAGITAVGVQPTAPADFAGTWVGTAQIFVNWTTQRTLSVHFTIFSDGRVSGTVGDATLRNARFLSNRGPLLRMLHWKTDWAVTADLDGPVIQAEDHFEGGVNTSGSLFRVVGCMGDRPCVCKSKGIIRGRRRMLLRCKRQRTDFLAEPRMSAGISASRLRDAQTRRREDKKRRETMTSSATVERFLAHPALALVGASRSGRKFGNLACRELSAKGYRIYPIHPSADAIDGVRCYQGFADLPERVDAVLVVVPPAQAVTVIHQAAAAGIHHIWLQQGAESPEVLQACDALGIDAVSGECILMFARPTGYHKAHRWLWRLLRKLPA